MQKKQLAGESNKDFLAALQRLSIHCKFGAYLNTALRNQFVFGQSNHRIQARLLEMKDLTLEKAVQIATTMELAEKGALQISTDQPTQVDSLHFNQQRRTSKMQPKEKFSSLNKNNNNMWQRALCFQVYSR
ncbi:uncharacterized protein LOC116846846 isoform X1 [Odontomachus brunneus]|uniref:uncharacterized protein LOC116846846 isoform X1 n=2 Tax=Odontomachus brunneus TaxID=486640 RepID=UPI0013F23174|nr:uncharacterized protein LOC116846846 isoform X1 [Odontomachus brunneus]